MRQRRRRIKTPSSHSAPFVSICSAFLLLIYLSFTLFSPLSLLASFLSSFLPSFILVPFPALSLSISSVQPNVCPREGSHTKGGVCLNHTDPFNMYLTGVRESALVLAPRRIMLDSSFFDVCYELLIN